MQTRIPSAILSISPFPMGTSVRVRADTFPAHDIPLPTLVNCQISFNNSVELHLGGYTSFALTFIANRT